MKSRRMRRKDLSGTLQSFLKTNKAMRGPSQAQFSCDGPLDEGLGLWSCLGALWWDVVGWSGPIAGVVQMLLRRDQLRSRHRLSARMDTLEARELPQHKPKKSKDKFQAPLCFQGLEASSRRPVACDAITTDSSIHRMCYELGRMTAFFSGQCHWQHHWQHQWQHHWCSHLSAPLPRPHHHRGLLGL